MIVLAKTELESLMTQSPTLAVQMMKSICSRLRDVSSSPRLDVALPKIQEQIQQFKAEIRRPRSASSTEASPSPPRRAASKAQEPAPDAQSENVENVKLMECPDCNRSFHPDDNFCASCGKPLS